MSVYDTENFAGRVKLAASYILQGRRTTRTFDTCFEMHDGDVVAAALYRRAENNPKLAEALPRYLNADLRAETVAKFAGIPTRELPEEARRTRAERRASFDALCAARDARQNG